MKKKPIHTSFTPGSEWVYFKIYCGVKTADNILSNYIYDVVKKLLLSKTIDQWFFIRYSDPNNHLRIRFHLVDTADFSKVANALNKTISPMVNANLIWDVSINTYKREFNRYGLQTISLIEKYFFYDSMNILELIQKSHDNDDLRFKLTLKLVDEILETFNLSPKDKLNYLNNLQRSYKNEFSINTLEKRELNKRYQSLSIKKEALIEFKNLTKLNKIGLKLKLLNMEDKLEIQFENLISSIIHMTINRCFKTKQRLYEMVIYDFLYKTYNTKKYNVQ